MSVIIGPTYNSNWMIFKTKKVISYNELSGCAWVVLFCA